MRRREPLVHDRQERGEAGRDDGRAAVAMEPPAYGIALAEALREGGRPLAPNVRAPFETRLGRDFSGVRVHDGPAAAASAHTLGANAYTVGRDIVFGQGAYAPGTAAGDRLLAHELTHVAQQEGGRRGGELTISHPGDAAERQAAAVAAGARVAVTPTPVHIQRDNRGGTAEMHRGLAEDRRAQLGVGGEQISDAALIYGPMFEPPVFRIVGTPQVSLTPHAIEDSGIAIRTVSHPLVTFTIRAEVAASSARPGGLGEWTVGIVQMVASDSHSVYCYEPPHGTTTAAEERFFVNEMDHPPGLYRPDRDPGSSDIFVEYINRGEAPPPADQQAHPVPLSGVTGREARARLFASDTPSVRQVRKFRPPPGRHDSWSLARILQRGNFYTYVVARRRPPRLANGVQPPDIIEPLYIVHWHFGADIRYIWPGGMAEMLFREPPVLRRRIVYARPFQQGDPRPVTTGVLMNESTRRERFAASCPTVFMP